MKLAGLALPLIVVYLIADVGSVAGGWLSSRLLARGWSVNGARKTAMLLMACIVVPTAFVTHAPNQWAAVLMVAVAAAAHPGSMANVFTLPSDMFPRSAVGSVVGIGAFAGAMGSVVFQRTIGRILDANGQQYGPIFVSVRHGVSRGMAADPSPRAASRARADHGTRARAGTARGDVAVRNLTYPAVAVSYSR